jgi:effector-binding domain-containing protein
VKYTVQLEPVESRPLAVVRRRATQPELGKVIPEACGLVWNVVKAQKIPRAGRHIALYWDDEFNLEVGVELEAPLAGHEEMGEVVASATPAGLVATTVHMGPYPQLVEAHRAIHEWCQQNGRTIAGPSWELYGHWEHAWCDDPSLIRTDVYYLIRAEA